MRQIVLVLILLLVQQTAVYAHSGRTDSNGGHRDNSNGTYHYHNRGSSSSRTTAPRTIQVEPQPEILVNLYINEERIYGANLEIRDNMTTYGLLGAIAAGMGIEDESVISNEDFIPVAVFLMSHNYEVEWEQVDSTNANIFAVLNDDAFIDIDRDIAVDAVSTFNPELDTINYDVSFARRNPGSTHLIINNQEIVNADVETRENGRSYGLLGPIASAIGITISKVTSNEDLVPIAAFLTSHGYAVEWIDDPEYGGTILAWLEASVTDETLRQENTTK